MVVRQQLRAKFPPHMLHREHHSSVLLLRLAHGKASALDIELLEALEKELDIARDAGAVVLTGVGGIFSAGVDLYRVVDGGEAYAKAFFPLLVRVLRKLFMLAAPLVVACNGHAIAGGAIFLAAGDRRLMADGRGRVGVPELLVGVPFPALALEIVRFALGPRAQYLAYTGTTLLANEANIGRAAASYWLNGGNPRISSIVRSMLTVLYCV